MIEDKELTEEDILRGFYSKKVFNLLKWLGFDCSVRYLEYERHKSAVRLLKKKDAHAFKSTIDAMGL